jgi:hypothetical protein
VFASETGACDQKGLPTTPPQPPNGLPFSHRERGTSKHQKS